MARATKDGRARRLDMAAALQLAAVASRVPLPEPEPEPQPMPASPNTTKPRQFRLTEETLELLDRISGHYALASRADAIRIAARVTADQIESTPKKPRNPKAQS